MNIKEFLEQSSKVGLYLPMAHDGVKNQPSVTLLFVYLTNLLAIISLVVLHFQADKTVATIISCIYGIIWVVLYMFRALQKAKFDLDDKSIELEGTDDKKDS